MSGRRLPAKRKLDANLAEAIKAIADAVEAEEGPMTAKKRRIVEAALECFAERGYEAASTSEIARKAGVAEGTIFRHFSTKKDLLIRLVRPVAGRLIVPAALHELEEINAEARGNFEVVAKRVMRSRLAFADRYAPLLRILLQELPLQPELRAVLFSDAFVRGLSEMTAAMKAFQDSGELRQLPPMRIIRWFGAVMAVYYLVRTFWPAEWDDEEEIDATIDFLLHGVSGRKLR